jgi:hypothetical protein
MVDCPERNQISRAIANAVREESHLRRVRTGDRFEQFQKVQTAREKVKRLREEYREHVIEHGCLPSDGATLAADAAG